MTFPHNYLCFHQTVGSLTQPKLLECLAASGIKQVFAIYHVQKSLHKIKATTKKLNLQLHLLNYNHVVLVSGITCFLKCFFSFYCMLMYLLYLYFFISSESCHSALFLHCRIFSLDWQILYLRLEILAILFVHISLILLNYLHLSIAIFIYQKNAYIYVSFMYFLIF